MTKKRISTFNKKRSRHLKRHYLNRTQRGGLFGFYEQNRCMHPLKEEYRFLKHLLKEWKGDGSLRTKESFFEVDSTLNQNDDISVGNQLNSIYRNAFRGQHKTNKNGVEHVHHSLYKTIIKAIPVKWQEMMINHGVKKGAYFEHRNGPFSLTLGVWTTDKDIENNIKEQLDFKKEELKRLPFRFVFQKTIRTLTKLKQIWQKQFLDKPTSEDEKNFFDILTDSNTFKQAKLKYYEDYYSFRKIAEPSTKPKKREYFDENSELIKDRDSYVLS